MQKSETVITELTRAYELGFKNLADYCSEQNEKHNTGQAMENIMKKIDKFFSAGIYNFIPPEDKEKIKNIQGYV